MTSASAPDWKAQGVDGSLLIEKPFAPAQLAAAVSQLLDSGPRRVDPDRCETAILLGSADRQRGGDALAVHVAAARAAAIAIQSRSRPLSSFEKDARRLRSARVSSGWHRSKSSRISDSR